VLTAQLSDTHLLRDPNGWRWGHNPAENLASVVEEVPPVDVVVVTGDIADDGSVESGQQPRLADAPPLAIHAGDIDEWVAGSVGDTGVGGIELIGRTT
jgi:3',5'-cyclic AMP phosphodiesterase CpdA